MFRNAHRIAARSEPRRHLHQRYEPICKLPGAKVRIWPRAPLRITNDVEKILSFQELDAVALLALSGLSVFGVWSELARSFEPSRLPIKDALMLAATRSARMSLPS